MHAKNKVALALHREGLHGICFLEFDVLTNITGEPGRRILFHIHCYVWPADGAKLQPIVVGNKLSASRAFPNELKAPSVVFKPVTLNLFSVARLGEYMTKFPPAAKNRVPNRDKPGMFKFRSAELIPSCAMRLAEIMTHLDAPDVVLGVGDGTEMAAAWRIPP